MRIDSHQHFWRYRAQDYPWISPEMGSLKKDYLPAHIEPRLAEVDFEGCIAVQARQSIEETGWLLDLARSYDFVKGVVGWVDLCSPHAEAQLEMFVTDAKFVGVRHVLQDEEDDRFMLRDDFRRGLQLVQKHRLVYDLLILPRHLPYASDLVDEFPDQQFVLDHIAKPLIADAVISPWDEGIRALSEFPNVACKLSGMVTEAVWGDWTAADFKPYLDHVQRCFGVDRLMIGSDWPVCQLSASYAQTMSIVTNFVAGLAAEDQAKILGGNCERIYRL